MDHVIRSCDLILQHHHSSSMLLQVINIAMEMLPWYIFRRHAYEDYYIVWK